MISMSGCVAWAVGLLALICGTSAFAPLRLPFSLETSARPPLTLRPSTPSGVGLAMTAGEDACLGGDARGATALHPVPPEYLPGGTSRRQSGLAAGTSTSRREVLAGLAAGAGCLWVAQPGGALAVESAEGSFTVAFNVSKGPLGIKLQELRFPPKKAPWDAQQAVVIVSAVDPLAQGIRQDKRLRSGLTVVSVQGRSTAGKSAKEAIAELESEIVARSGPKEVWNAAAAAKAGIPELVEITFSDGCVSLKEQPDVCYNSVMPVGSVQPMDITEDEDE